MRDEKEGRSKQDVTDSYRPSSVGIKYRNVWNTRVLPRICNTHAKCREAWSETVDYI